MISQHMSNVYIVIYQRIAYRIASHRTIVLLYFWGWGFAGFFGRGRGDFMLRVGCAY
jgi:hypothetical protein